MNSLEEDLRILQFFKMTSVENKSLYRFKYIRNINLVQVNVVIFYLSAQVPIWYPFSEFFITLLPET